MLPVARVMPSVVAADESYKFTVLNWEATPPDPMVSMPVVLPTLIAPLLAPKVVAKAVSVVVWLFNRYIPPKLAVPPSAASLLMALITAAAVWIGAVPVTVPPPASVPPMVPPACRVNVLAVTVNGPEPLGLTILLLGEFSVKSTLEKPILLSTMNVLLAKVPSVTRILLLVPSVFVPAVLVPLIPRLIRLVFSVLSSIKLMLPLAPSPLEVSFNRVPVEALPAVVVVYTGATMPMPPAALSITPPAAVVSVVVILALFRLGVATPSPLISPKVVTSLTKPEVEMPLFWGAVVPDSVSLTVPTTKPEL